MSRVILIEVEPEAAALLRGAAPEVVDFLQADGVPQGMALLEGPFGAEVGAVVLGLQVAEPVRTAQRVYARQPDVAVLILSERPCPQIERALSFAPFVGEDAHCHAMEDAPDLAAELQRALARTLLRRQQRALADLLDERLGRRRPREGFQAAYYLGRLFDQSPVGAVFVDQDDRILSLNVKAAALLGRSERELLGTPLHSLFPATPGQDPWPPLLERHTAEGGPQILEVTASKLHLGDGRWGHLVLLGDATARVQAERAREQAALEAIRARDDFISMASHELRSPLTPLHLQLQNLRRQLRRQQEQPIEPAPVLERIELALRQTERLGKLIEHLLDTSRISAGRLELNPEEVDLSTLVREVSARFAADLEQAGCPLQLTTQGPVVGHWDRMRLEQVYTNLLSNAMKYGAGAAIEVSGVSDGSWAVLRVRDHGIGITREAQARIFERFERAASDTHYRGFGLGLWIVRQIVEAMGGTIRVESEPGHGATFRVELPLQSSR